ncbi:helix-turn-helix domain-containing protein [Dermatophilaceae bacterium Soc4.6]
MSPAAPRRRPTPPPGALLVDPEVIAALRASLGDLATTVVAAIADGIPAYAGQDPLREADIETAVQLALGGFLTMAARAPGDLRPRPAARDTAYGLGRGEARSGRSVESLLAAYRIGARVSWQELSGVLVRLGVEAGVVARFAALVFSYIDDLSAASAAGHADELSSADRVLERQLERLALELLRGASLEVLERRVERAQWPPPTAATTLTAVLLLDADYSAVRSVLDPRSLALSEDLPDAPDGEVVVFLVPDVLDRARRQRLIRSLTGHRAVLGPARPWALAASSYQRALRGWRLESASATSRFTVYDTDAHLADMVLTADPDALADLRAVALAPLDGLTASARTKLEATLRLWLLHQGRREAIAEGLVVHPQTVRYRMGQLRDLYGERLDDPSTLLDLTIALGVQG